MFSLFIAKLYLLSYDAIYSFANKYHPKNNLSLSMKYYYGIINNFWSFSNLFVVAHVTLTFQIISDGIPVVAKGKSKCQSKH